MVVFRADRAACRHIIADAAERITAIQYAPTVVADYAPPLGSLSGSEMITDAHFQWRDHQLRQQRIQRRK